MTRAGTGSAARARRELAAVLLAGLAGAGLVLFGSRQALARVFVHPPRPLPASVTAVSASDLRPAITALAIAALASLAAVVATRGPLRRLTGLVTVALGAGIALVGLGAVTAPAVRAAAARADSASAGSTAGGTGAGSATSGASQPGAAGSITGYGSHVLFSGPGWQVLLAAGAALIAAAGVVVVVRAARLPAMSGRYEPPQASAAAAVSPGSQAGRPEPGNRDSGAAAARAGSATMWESLSAGQDPTL